MKFNRFNLSVIVYISTVLFLPKFSEFIVSLGGDASHEILVSLIMSGIISLLSIMMSGLMINLLFRVITKKESVRSIFGFNKGFQIRAERAYIASVISIFIIEFYLIVFAFMNIFIFKTIFLAYESLIE